MKEGESIEDVLAIRRDRQRNASTGEGPSIDPDHDLLWRAIVALATTMIPVADDIHYMRRTFSAINWVGRGILLMLGIATALATLGVMTGVLG